MATTGDIKPQRTTLPKSTELFAQGAIIGDWSSSTGVHPGRVKCDPATVTSYLASGDVVRAQSRARYAARGRSIIEYGTIRLDVDAGEDRSDFDKVETRPVEFLDPDLIKLGDVALHRCNRS